MAYVSIWENLSDARNEVMANTGCSQEQAEADICQAVSDGAINFQGELKLHTTKRMTARGTVLEGTAFRLPPSFGRGDLDWEKSTSRRPLLVKRGHFELPGHWEMERIRLSKAHMRSVLCTCSNSTQRDDSESGTGGKTQLASSAEAPIAPDPTSTDGSRDRALSAARRRGRRPTKLNAAKEAMRQEILAGGITLEALMSLLEKNLAEKYSVSRDTARKARNAVLSEFDELNSRQKATNDN